MTAIVERRTGKLLFTIQGDAESVKINTPVGAIAVDDPPRVNMYYANGWLDIPPAPSDKHVFNYDVKQWVDTRTLYELKTQKWEELKARRDELEFGGFEYEGNIYDSDQVSQGRILGAANAGVDQVWTLANNTTVELTADDLRSLYAALQSHVASAHERGRVARYKLDAALTPLEIENIQL